MWGAIFFVFGWFGFWVFVVALISLGCWPKFGR
jgi:hypothetical protein